MDEHNEAEARQKYPNIAKLADLFNQFEEPRQTAVFVLQVAAEMMGKGRNPGRCEQ